MSLGQPRAVGGDPFAALKPGQSFRFDGRFLPPAGVGMRQQPPPVETVVQGVSRAMTEGYEWRRVHVAEGFFEVGFDLNGAVEECRWYSWFDQVAPQSPAEWAFWLAPTDGMIGWPEFQTKDGVMWRRIWPDGGQRAQPIDIEEAFEQRLDHLPSLARWSCMLYQRPTGAIAPAVTREMLMVAALEQDGQKTVELFYAMDLDPRALGL